MAFTENFSIDDLSFDTYGLIPAIAQDWLDGSILMLAWMNKESLKLTLETKNVHYWSRSRAEIWRKGATSGNTPNYVSDIESTGTSSSGRNVRISSKRSMWAASLT